jgi:hypothetical protein
MRSKSFFIWLDGWLTWDYCDRLILHGAPVLQGPAITFCTFAESLVAGATHAIEGVRYILMVLATKHMLSLNDLSNKFSVKIDLMIYPIILIMYHKY